MADKEKEPSLLTVNASIDDDEQDEEFVASDEEEVDSDAASSSDDGSSSDEDESEDEEEKPTSAAAAPVSDLPDDVREQLLRALEGDNASHQPRDEQIISDSEISQEFSEEEDDVLGALAGSSEEDSDSSDDDDEDEVSSDGGASGAPTVAAASLAAAQSVAENGGIATRQQKRLLADHTAPQSSADPSKRTAAASPSLEVFGAKLGNLDEISSVPIAQRTRAHMSLVDVNIEQLEADLDPYMGQEPLIYFDIDDTEEYRRFITNLNGEEEAGRGADAAGMLTAEEDSDDEDYVMELERMLEEDDLLLAHDLGVMLPSNMYNTGGGSGGGNRRGGGKRLRWQLDEDLDADDEDERVHGNKRRKRTKGGRKYRRRKRKPRDKNRVLRRSERLKSLAKRPLYAQSIFQKQTGIDPAILAVSAGMQGFNNLDELASLAATMDDAVPIPLPSELHKTTFQDLPNIVQWKKPLLKAVRKMKKNEKEQQDAAAAAETSGPITQGLFQPSQYKELYSLIHQHVQLLEQTAIMATAERDVETLQASSKLLEEFYQFAVSQKNYRETHGIPPYVSGCLGIDTGEGVMEEQAATDGEDGAGPSNYNKRDWTLQNPGNVFTVADVAVLRSAPRVSQQLMSRLQAVAAGIEVDDEEEPVEEQRQVETHPDGRPKRKYVKKQPKKHPIWDNLPSGIVNIMAPVKRFFDPGLEPKAPGFVVTSQMLFTPAEDELLAWGIRKHLYEWETIRDELLPTKDPKIIFNRKKNRCVGAAPQNIVKQVAVLITGNITPSEESVISQALDYYGKQRQRWEFICKEHLPWRHPKVLAMLWAKKSKEAAAGASGQQVNLNGLPGTAAVRPTMNSVLVDSTVGAIGGGTSTLGTTFNPHYLHPATTAPMGVDPNNSSMQLQAVAAAAAAAAANAAEMAARQQQQQRQQQYEEAPSPPPQQRITRQTVEEEAPPNTVNTERNAVDGLYDLLMRRPQTVTWTPEEERMIAKAVMNKSCTISEEKLAEFKVSMGKSREVLVAKGAEMLEKLKKRAAEKKKNQVKK